MIERKQGPKESQNKKEQSRKNNKEQRRRAHTKDQHNTTQRHTAQLGLFANDVIVPSIVFCDDNYNFLSSFV